MSGRARAGAGARLLVGCAALLGSALAIPLSGVRGAAPTGGVAPVAEPAPAVADGRLRLVDASVAPRRAYVAGAPVRVAFAVRGVAPGPVEVDVVREATRRPVRRFELPAPAADGVRRVTWDAMTGGGRVAAAGRYRVRVRVADGRARNAGRLVLRTHVHPVRGPHADRGPIGRFGVGRSGGRRHEGFDVDAPCRTPVVAARGGVVTRADHDPVLYGNVVVIRGAHTQRDYWYSHLLRRPRLKVGDRVATGRRIGSIGATGNARTIGCHLHFEIRRRGRPIDPAPHLRAWDRWS